MYENMTEKGMEFLTEPIIKKDSQGITTSICYGHDPEGNWLEFKGIEED